MYKQGFLPASGAISDQSNKAVEIFRILDDVNSQIDQEQSTDKRKGSRE